MTRIRRLLPAALPLALAACVSQPPLPPRPAALAPARWQAALPHHGKVADLTRWWQEQGDPLLPDLIAAAEAASPTLASARARVAQARAQDVAAGAALAPELDAAASAVRTSRQSAAPMATTAQAGLQAAWEIDLFGGGRATRAAAQERYQGAQALWHAARVSVAAETANQYYDLRSCAALLEVARQDAASRRDSARVTELAAQAGFQAPANAALARASAAEGADRLSAQQARCDVTLKGLVALTGLAETDLRGRLAARAPVAPPELSFTALPAATLAQRPDVYAAARDVAAASADVGAAEAARYPRLTLQGAIGKGRLTTGGASISASTWSVGPLAVTLPVFDAGRRRAATDAARAQYDAAAAAYRATARQAVREVEEALVNLDATSSRAASARAALDGYRTAFTAAEDRYKNGFASLIELEDARRIRLAAENAVVTLERERSAAWVALYRAAGGGWSAPTRSPEWNPQ